MLKMWFKTTNFIYILPDNVARQNCDKDSVFSRKCQVYMSGKVLMLHAKSVGNV